MQKSGREDWKWPAKPDQLIYERNDIKQIISCPKQKNARGAYSVPEMSNYKEFM